MSLWKDYLTEQHAEAFLQQAKPLLRRKVVIYRKLSSKWNEQIEKQKSKIKAFDPMSADYIKVDNDIRVLRAAKKKELAPLENEIQILKNRILAVSKTNF